MRRLLFATVCLAVAAVLYAVSPGKQGGNYSEYAAAAPATFVAIVLAAYSLYYYITGVHQVAVRWRRSRHPRLPAQLMERRIDNLVPIRPRVRAPQRTARFKAKQNADYRDDGLVDDWPVREFSYRLPSRSRV